MFGSGNHVNEAMPIKFRYSEEAKKIEKISQFCFTLKKEIK